MILTTSFWIKTLWFYWAYTTCFLVLICFYFIRVLDKWFWKYGCLTGWQYTVIYWIYFTLNQFLDSCKCEKNRIGCLVLLSLSDIIFYELVKRKWIWQSGVQKTGTAGTATFHDFVDIGKHSISQQKLFFCINVYNSFF